jgi:catechol 2,3-dioxygenase-like lactoylglutathione lyase family enzyme
LRGAGNAIALPGEWRTIVKIKGYAWAGLATDDFQRSLQFFSGVLGLPVEVRHDDLAIFRVGPGQQLEIFGGDHPGKRLTGNPVIAFEVEDFAGARSELIAAGVELLGEPGSGAGYQWQYFRDPDGHIFEIKAKLD